MNLRELIEAEKLADLPYEEIVDRLNARPLIPNSEPEGLIPAPITKDQIMAIVSLSELQQISGIDFQDWIRTLVLGDDQKNIAKNLILALSNREHGTILGSINYLLSENNTDALQGFVSLLVFDGKITTETAQAFSELLQTQIPDPDYRDQIEGKSLSEIHGLGIISATQIQEAMN